MAQTLLQNSRPLGESTFDLAQAYPDWPLGHPKGRLLQEYLVGRRSGQLDIAGRPAAQAIAFDERPLLVIDDDEEGALARVCVAAKVGPVTVFDDVVAAAVDRTTTIDTVSALQDLAADGGTEYRIVLTAPKALLALREYLQLLAGRAAEFLVIGRDRHMSRSINSELAKFFDRVDIAPGMSKSRLLVASGPKDPAHLQQPTQFPQRAVRSGGVDGVPDMTVCAHGACFGGTGVDAGSALLLSTLAERRKSLGDVRSLLDLGCGNGWLLAAAATLLRPSQALGVDVSAFAVESARATLAANSVAGRILRSVSGDGLPEGSCDLVLLNPPFHDGTKLTADPARDMVAGAHRVLAPGGLFVCVYNSVLRHRTIVNQVFGRSEQWVRDRRFTVVAARKG